MVTNTVIPCAVKMPIPCFERLKSSIVTPAGIAKRPCSKTNSGDLDISIDRSHLQSLRERHVSDLRFRYHRITECKSRKCEIGSLQSMMINVKDVDNNFKLTWY